MGEKPWPPSALQLATLSAWVVRCWRSDSEKPWPHRGGRTWRVAFGSVNKLLPLHKRREWWHGVWGAGEPHLGNLYVHQGRLDEAEAMYQRALHGCEKALGPDHTSTLDTVNNLGLLYVDQGRLGEAETMYQRALQGKEKALGPDHTSTLETVNNLGILYVDQGRLEEAEAMYQRALQGYEKALGPAHTSILSTVNNLGILYGRQGRLEEAEAMYQRALSGFQATLGPSHPKSELVSRNIHSLQHGKDLSAVDKPPQPESRRFI